MIRKKTYQTDSLVEGLNKLATLPISQLKEAFRIAEIIRTIGLSFDPRNLYGEDNVYMNHSRWGLWQCPEQLAPLLVKLSDFEINSWCEIGTFKGWTTTFVTAYLKRFNPQLSTITIDPINHQKDRTAWDELNIQYIEGCSEQLAGEKFDFCFIDGDHSANAVRQDFENLGRWARLCAFHDIQEELCPDVVKFWGTLKQKYPRESISEYLHHSQNRKIMGIGLLTLPESSN